MIDGGGILIIAGYALVVGLVLKFSNSIEIDRSIREDIYLMV